MYFADIFSYLLDKNTQMWYDNKNKKDVFIMNIPNDLAILVSFLNTQLRDFYPSLAEFCKANDVDQQEIEEKLAKIGYAYDAAQNRFR